MYDPAQLIHIVGTVKSYQWTNPHVMVWVVREQPAGELWTIELPTSPGNLTRMGWSKTSLVAGDHVDVEVNPLRDGQHGGSFKKVTLVDSGKVLVASAPAAPDAGSDAAAPPQAVDCSDTQDEHAAHAGHAAQAKTAGCACAVGHKPTSAWDGLQPLLALVCLWHRNRRAPRMRRRVCR